MKLSAAGITRKKEMIFTSVVKFGGKPNTHICPVCMGLPGSLPQLNKTVIKYAIKAGLALNCSITRYGRIGGNL